MLRVALILAAVGFPMTAHAAPSTDLVDKTLELSWTENRQQRTNGSEVKTASVTFDLKIYVSSKARPFTRLTSRARTQDISNEQVGASGSSLGGGVRSVRADGNTIVLQANFGNYARILQIQVSGGSCSAQMSIGKAQGSQATAYRNVAGMMVEIHSVTASTPTCSIQSGNSFAR